MDLHDILNYKIWGIRIEDPLVFLWKVFIVILLTRLLLFVIKKLFDRSARRPRSILDPTTRSYLERIIRVVVYVVAIASVLVLIPGMEKIGSSILTSAGILAAAIGLASQDALSNFIGGLFIIISKPFRVGDYIQLDGNVAGTVKEITLRHTVIVNTENRTIFVPNSKINSNVIVNSTVLDSRTCAFVEVGVAYHEDLDRVFAILRDEVSKHPLLIDHRTDEEKEAGIDQIKVKVISLDDSSIKVRAWAWAATTTDAFTLKCDLLKSIKERFDAEGIEIPYPYFNQIIQASQTDK